MKLVPVVTNATLRHLHLATPHVTHLNCVYDPTTCIGDNMFYIFTAAFTLSFLCLIILHIIVCKLQID